MLPSIVVVRVPDDKIIWFSGQQQLGNFFFFLLSPSCWWEIERTLIARLDGPDQAGPLAVCAAAADGIKKQSVSSSSFFPWLAWNTTCSPLGAIDISHRFKRQSVSMDRNGPVSYSINQGRKQHACAFFPPSSSSGTHLSFCGNVDPLAVKKRGPNITAMENNIKWPPLLLLLLRAII